MSEQSPSGLLLAGLAGLALGLAAALPDWKLPLAWPGSGAQSMGFYAPELAAWALGLAALLSGEARRRVPPAAWLLAGLWCLALAWGCWQGWRQGTALRDVLAEGRAALLAPALLGFVALSTRGWKLALAAASGGLLLGLSQQGLLLVLEPTGHANLSVVPVAVLMTEHHLPRALLMCLALLALLLRQSERPSALRAWALLLLWTLVWLSFLRSLWVALALGSLMAGVGLALSGRGRASLRLWTWQAGLALAGLALALLWQRAVTPDGGYLLRFRLQRLAQAAHLMQPPPETLELGRPYSALFRGLVRRGGLYRNVIGHPQERSAQEQRAQDPSLLDRGLMRRLSWDAYRRRPLAGAGLGSVVRYSYLPGMDRVQRDPHQGYLWLLKCGVLGILAGAAVLLVPLAAAWRSLRSSYDARSAWALAGLSMLGAAELFHVGWLQVPALLAWALVAAAALRPRAA